MNWSFPLGRVFGIRLRMHWMMLLMIAVYLIQGATRSGWLGLGWMSVTMAILLFSILVHELAHCGMAIRLGGSAEKILFWPLGGLSFIEHSSRPWDIIKVSGIGPLSSLLLSACCFAALPFLKVTWQWSFLLPFDDWWPGGFGMLEVFILHAGRLNLLLAFFNLCVPAYPLDGGKVLFGFLSLRYGRLRAAQATAWIALPIGVAIAVLALAQGEILLAFIGVSVIYEAMQLRTLIRQGELDSHPAFGPSAPAYEYMPDRERPARKGWLARWREGRARKAAAREAVREEALRVDVDAVLDKVSREGIGSLSPQEKNILDEASRRRRGG